MLYLLNFIILRGLYLFIGIIYLVKLIKISLYPIFGKHDGVFISYITIIFYICYLFNDELTIVHVLAR